MLNNELKQELRGFAYDIGLEFKGKPVRTSLKYCTLILVMGGLSTMALATIAWRTIKWKTHK